MTLPDESIFLCVGLSAAAVFLVPMRTLMHLLLQTDQRSLTLRKTGNNLLLCQSVRLLQPSTSQ